ncbi:hypothetical protein [Chryseobacterium vrystaatense]|uniref:Uncharacterized protein n=1 Tax=Chryseobacterium vrystaatense TaxID=307480 RepID=A0ABR4UKC8_9FLAO|nr:hypothetical protein [Chryseobacterium vrystaatense]KFF25287.1 hypothetical protein IW16_14810 [Chryseobacterium vrystaatense]
MEFNNRILSKEVSLLFIDNFDINNWDDLNQLKIIYKSLFPKGSTLFFSFRREENLTEEKELKKLKVRILDTFNNEGEYLILKKLDDVRFDSIARIVINENTYNLIFDLWNYFYSCTFFIPNKNLTFSDYIKFQQKIKFQDKGNEKLLNECFTDFTCIKGLGGDNMIISYRNNYNLPNFYCKE